MLGAGIVLQSDQVAVSTTTLTSLLMTCAVNVEAGSPRILLALWALPTVIRLLPKLCARMSLPVVELSAVPVVYLHHK